MPIFTGFFSTHIQFNSPDSHSATLIANIFTNHLLPHVFTGIVLNDLSDNFLICALFYDKHKSEKKHFKRSLKGAVSRYFSQNSKR